VIELVDTNRVIDSAGRWFLHSGIQETHGGVARYYLSDVQKNAPVSTEITGYALSALLFLHERTQLQDYLDRALRAARFLTRVAWNPAMATFPFEHSSNGNHAQALAYFFDCGIIVRGLLGVWRTTGEAESRDAAIAGGRAMLADFCAHDAIHPILALPEKKALPYQPRWSASPGCYQLKSAMAWLELYEATGEAGFERAYERALEAALHSDRDFLPGDPDPDTVMDRLHAYSYFLEGLLPVLDRAECLARFRAGLGRVAEHLHEIAPRFARSDVYAQLLRARLYGENLAGVELDSESATREANALTTFQLEAPDRRLAGGFGFGRKAGQQLPFANPVSTAFALQALALWSDRQNNAFKAPRQALI
jgi:hypothetical protein